MKLEINGRPRELATLVTLGELVDDTVADRRGVAAALEGEVVPRTAWDTTILPDGARVEIVGAVQGG